MNERTDNIIAGEPGHTEAGPAGSFRAGESGSFRAGPAGHVPIDTRTPRRPLEHHPQIPLPMGSSGPIEHGSSSAERAVASSAAAETSRGTLVNAKDMPSRIPFPPTSGTPAASTNGDVRQQPVFPPLERPGSSPDPNAPSPSSGIKEAAKALLINKSEAKLVPPVTGISFAPHLSTSMHAEGMANVQNASYINVSHVPQINIQNLPQSVVVNPSASYTFNNSPLINSNQPLTLVNVEGPEIYEKGDTFVKKSEGMTTVFNFGRPKTSIVDIRHVNFILDPRKPEEFIGTPKTTFEAPPKFEPQDVTPGLDFSDSYPDIKAEFFEIPSQRFEELPKFEPIPTVPDLDFPEAPPFKGLEMPKVRFEPTPKFEPLPLKPDFDFETAPPVDFEPRPDYDPSAADPRVSLLYVSTDTPTTRTTTDIEAALNTDNHIFDDKT